MSTKIFQKQNRKKNPAKYAFTCTIVFWFDYKKQGNWWPSLKKQKQQHSLSFIIGGKTFALQQKQPLDSTITHWFLLFLIIYNYIILRKQLQWVFRNLVGLDGLLWFDASQTFCIKIWYVRKKYHRPIVMTRWILISTDLQMKRVQSW